MNWRTDKPTANVIVAVVNYNTRPEYEILICQPDGEYANEYHDVPIKHIIKWADLEEDDNGIYITYKDISNLEEIMNYVHYEFRNGISKDNFGKEVIEQFKNSYLEEDETVTDCKDLADEIVRVSKRYPEVSFAKLSRIAKHFAKWGAGHLKK